MKLYLSLISICVLLLSLVVSVACKVHFLYAFGLSVCAVVLVIIVDGVVAGIARSLPEKFARHESKIFTVSVEEKKFYEKLKIRKWKDKVPEIGHFTGFRKNKIADPQSVEYVERYLLEACYGEIGHFWGVFFGFFILLFFPISPIWLSIAMPVAIINIFFCLPSLVILRYNSYKLEILRKNLLKKHIDKR